MPEQLESVNLDPFATHDFGYPGLLEALTAIRLDARTFRSQSERSTYEYECPFHDEVNQIEEVIALYEGGPKPRWGDVDPSFNLPRLSILAMHHIGQYIDAFGLLHALETEPPAGLKVVPLDALTARLQGTHDEIITSYGQEGWERYMHDAGAVLPHLPGPTREGLWTLIPLIELGQAQSVFFLEAPQTYRLDKLVFALAEYAARGNPMLEDTVRKTMQAGANLCIAMRPYTPANKSLSEC